MLLQDTGKDEVTKVYTVLEFDFFQEELQGTINFLLPLLEFLEDK